MSSMSCFGAMPATTDAYYYPRSSSGRPGGGGRRQSWRWWRAKCVGIAAAVGSRLRKSVTGGVDGRRHRRRTSSSSSSVHYYSQNGWCHHHQRSFAPVYVTDLYSHHHNQPAAKALRGVGVVHQHEPTSTSARDDKLATTTTTPASAHRAHAAAGGAAVVTKVGVATPMAMGATDAASHMPASGGNVGKQQQQQQHARAMASAAAGVGVGAMRNVLLRSPGRGVGGGGVLGKVKGMGEVDLRAELFIRKFREDMRLQSQRSAEEFQAMLARGL